VFVVCNTVATLCLVTVSCYTSDMWLVFNWLFGWLVINKVVFCFNVILIR